MGVGLHVFSELYDCAADIDYLGNIGLLMADMRAAATNAGATVIDELQYNFEGQGATVSLLLNEGHFTIHVWPEYRYIAADIFTFGNQINPLSAISALGDKVRCKRPVVCQRNRGLDI